MKTETPRISLTCIYCTTSDVICQKIPVGWTEVRERMDEGDEVHWTHVGVCPHHWCKEQSSEEKRQAGLLFT